MNVAPPHRPALRFTAAFAAWSAGFAMLAFLPPFQSFLAALAQHDAWAAGTVLHALGQHCHTDGVQIVSSRYLARVEDDCTAMELIGAVSALILAFPAALWQKAIGMGVAVISIETLNLTRIVSVFLAGEWWPRVVPLFHEDLWPGLLELAALALAASWVFWTLRRGGGPDEAQKRVRSSLRRFAVIFCLLLVPWPWISPAYGPAFRAAGVALFASPRGPRDIAFEPLGGHGTRIEIVNRKLMATDGSGPVRDVDLDEFAMLWRPLWLLVALLAATPMSRTTRYRALAIGTSLLLAYIFCALAFTLWNESSAVLLAALTPWEKRIADLAQVELFRELGLTVTVLIWLMVCSRAWLTTPKPQNALAN